ncbi:hypothetical protein [Pseudoalteromonas sp. PPB1]|uniref:hypothetical protein n=2 Tax=unclassified Pseudoalteromonas TaxID=194690 RepID=UPI001E560C28|nr:hypothetical protein [Pseudoalteromonas sp. PPB1]
MRKSLKVVDLVVRYMAIVGLALFGGMGGIFAFTALVSPSVSDTSQLLIVLQILVCGVAIWLVMSMAYSPKSLAKFTPLSEPQAVIVARVIVYPIGAALGLLLIRQVLLVAIPDLFGVFQ